jgi:hypothetical protein
MNIKLWSLWATAQGHSGEPAATCTAHGTFRTIRCYNIEPLSEEIRRKVFFYLIEHHSLKAYGAVEVYGPATYVGQ